MTPRRFSILAALSCAALLCAACEREAAPAPPPAPPTLSETEAPEIDPPGRERPELGPPEARDDLMLRAHPAERLDAATMHMGRGFVVRLERTRMDEIQEVIGVGDLREFTEAGASRAWLCYTVPGSQRLWFVSSSNFNSEVVATVRAVIDREAQPTRECPTLPAQFRPVAFEPDLWLGTTQQRLTTLYGEAEAQGEWIAYLREGIIRNDNLSYSESRSLAVRLENGRVAELEAIKGTSY